MVYIRKWSKVKNLYDIFFLLNDKVQIYFQAKHDMEGVGGGMQRWKR